MKRYYITKGSRRLGGFFPNGYGDVFVFNKNNYFSEDSEDEAKIHLKSMKRRLTEEIKSGRWSEEEINNNLKIFKSLRIVPEKVKE